MSLVDLSIGVAFGVHVKDSDKHDAIRSAYNELPDDKRSLVTIHQVLGQFIVCSTRLVNSLSITGTQMLFNDELFIQSRQVIEQLCGVDPEFYAVAL
jgi:hypothetical protein